jgi:vesicle coat complex subunit
VLRYYKYQTAGSTVLTILVYTYSKEILIECLKFIEETKYKNAIPAVSRFLEHNKPEIRSQAIRTIMRLDSEGFEDKVHSKLFDNNYEVRYQAAFSILNYCDDGEEKLSELAYDLQNNNAAAVSRMLISEKKVKEG